MKKIIPILLLTCLFTTSCLHFEEVAINPNSKAKFEFAVFGFLAPADSIYITMKAITNVGEVIKSNATALTKIQNVRIADLETNQSIELISKNSSGIYSASQRNFPILINHTYKLVVKVLDGLDITAQTQIPQDETTDLSISSSEPFFDTNYEGYLFKLSGNFIGKYDSLGYKVLLLDYEQKNYVQSNLLTGSEVTKVGKKHGFRYEGYFSSLSGNFQDTKLELYILTLEPNFKKFAEAYDIYYNIDDYILNGFGLAPLAGFKGIIPKFSNIKNGYGILGGYNLSPKQQISVKYPNK